MKKITFLICSIFICSCTSHGDNNYYQGTNTEFAYARTYAKTVPSSTEKIYTDTTPYLVKKAYREIECETDKFIKTISCHYSFTSSKTGDEYAVNSLLISADSQTKKIKRIYTSITSSNYITFISANDSEGKSIKVTNGPLLGTAQLGIGLPYYKSHQNTGTEIRVYSSVGHFDVNIKDYEIQAIFKYIKDNFKI